MHARGTSVRLKRVEKKEDKREERRSGVSPGGVLNWQIQRWWGLQREGEVKFVSVPRCFGN